MSTQTFIDYRILGRNIKDARIRLGKTQASVASEMNIITSTYGKFERGALKPSLERLVAICQILKLSVENSLRGAVNADIISSNAPPVNDRYVIEFQALMDKCHSPKSIHAMIAICQQVVILENSK